MVIKTMKKRKLGELSVEEFMTSGFDSDVTDAEEEMAAPPKPSKNTGKKKNAKTLKDSLSNLKDKDPEFYEFLKEEDKKLLDFSDDDDDETGDDDESIDDEVEESDDENGDDDDDELMKKLEAMESDSDDDDEDEDNADEVKKRVHKLPTQLEVSSHVDSSDDEMDGEDESDDDDDKHPAKERSLVTMKMIKEWSLDLQKNASLKSLRQLKKAFKAAVHKTSSDEGEISKFKVEGSKVFNAIVRACLVHVIPTLEKLLGLPKPSSESERPLLPSSSKKWRKVAGDVKGYLTTVVELLSNMADPAVVDVVLKHVHRLVDYYAVFPRLARIMLKKMITLWGSSEETTRVLAFLCIIKLIHRLKDTMLEFCLKRMYMTYVKNCKFTSPTTLPMINFMQRSLVEVFAVDVSASYQYGFIYIRQLAIHLRNAITVKKKDTCQAVYNWQYIHCLHLWARVVSTIYPNETLQHLIYPLTETIIGTIKLLPTARYYPLRFHCVRTLNLISSSTDTYIPVLPFLLEVFEQTDFNKKHKSISFKPFNFACILKLSKSQLVEKSFKDGVVDQLYELLLETFHIHSHCLGFPELALPAIIQIKDFLKKCKIANYCKQIKQVLEKVEENCKVINQKRKSANFKLSDKNAVDAWERKSREEGTPLTKYYTTWRKLRDREIQHEIAGKERLSMEFDKFPEIIRKRTPTKASAEDRKEFSELFNSDSEESDDENRFLLKAERSEPLKKKRKTSKENESDDSQEYSDFDSDELEQLAGSADDDSDDESSGDDDKTGENESETKDDDETGKGEDEESEEGVDQEDVVKDFVFSSDED